MRLRRATLALAPLLYLAACNPFAEAPKEAHVSADSPARQGKGFDFYVLSLSWSPSYCAAEGGDANRHQCDGQRRYAFVVHGLWPQFERGYPQDCATDGSGDVPRERMAELYDIMPSSGLIRYQWRKHGSCAGLSQADYFDVVRAARTRIAIPGDYQTLKTHLTVDPAAVETAFLAANPGMTPAGIAVTCDRRYLREVRICMTRSLEFRSCPEVDRDQCRASRAVMPPVRGG
ncbi:MAG: ribonuclease [Mesorhizobium sp.]|nr:ribonuclease [Mesorhizobium sp.]